MEMNDLIYEALCLPTSAITYSVSRQLAALYPERAVLEGPDCSFDPESYASGGQCEIRQKPLIHSQIGTGWWGPGKRIWQRSENSWYEVAWQGHSLDVILMTLPKGVVGEQTYYWILADTAEIAERFFQAVCEWCAEVRGEVLVFENGQWYKSEELFQAIQDATFDNLVLRGPLKQEIRDDLTQFFASRETYERYHVPWKRGILFIGPPGNGKTHTVKALINALGRPCLYVKSFKAEHQTDHDAIRDVFRRARQTTPCLLVLEDLDALIDGQNRSFFLNELDGFASNAGIVTLATTNHPERLDRSILERPSRFDRKYHFELPALPERLDYLMLWNQALEPALRLSEDGITRIVDLTEEFSFAYLKELFLSSMMRWITAPQPGGMEAVMAAQAGSLREQMSSAEDESGGEFKDEDLESFQRGMRAWRGRIAAQMRGPRGPR